MTVFCGFILSGCSPVGLDTVREVVERLYEFEEPFVVDHSDFARAFEDHAAEGSRPEHVAVVPRTPGREVRRPL
jgi:hypothetical protein